MNTTKIQVVATFLKATVTGTVVKSQFATEHNISTRTLGRWIEAFSDAANELIEAESNQSNDNVAPTTKRGAAQVVYTSNPGMKRSELIALMVSEAGLTAAGASTYISNFKTGKWDLAA